MEVITSAHQFIWEFDVTNFEWRVLRDRGNNDESLVSPDFHVDNYPRARMYFGDAQVYINNSTSTSISLLYGGESTSAKKLSDVWAYDLVRNLWKRVWPTGLSLSAGVDVDAVVATSIPGEFHPDNVPASRYHHITWLVEQMPGWVQLIIYGGVGADYSSPRAWRFDLFTVQWALLTGKSPSDRVYPPFGPAKRGIPHPEASPGIRREASSFMFAGSRDIHLFGGMGSEVLGHYGDLWSFNIDTNLWRFQYGTSGTNIVPRLDTTPATRSGANALMYRNRMYLFGGWRETQTAVWTCYGDLWEYNEWTCSDRGTIYPNSSACVCDEPWLYGGDFCESFECYGVHRNTLGVCSGHGVCEVAGQCRCLAGWDGDRCELPVCFGYASDNESVCASGGSCDFADVCTCHNDELESLPTKASRHGRACGEIISEFAEYDDVAERISLTYLISGEAFNSEEATEVIESVNCSRRIRNWELVGVRAHCTFLRQSFLSLPSALVGRDLLATEFQIDLPPYLQDATRQLLKEADVLQIVPISDPSNVVEVSVAFQTDEGFRWMELIVSLGVVLPVAILCGCVIVTILVFFVLRSKRKLRQQSVTLERFGELKDVDLLLLEQRAAERTDIGHINIRSDLFVVKYEEVKVSRRIGQGGSGAVIFLARYRGFVIAFKVFKTIDLCGSEESFGLFEKEVAILGSLSHPHILRFYGATIRPPRVGILLEYCSNGDLSQYISTFVKQNGTPVPFPERLRIMHEVASAMSFVHSRSIIHRDLKPENVLLTKDAAAKLMDFGISTIVKDLQSQKTQRIGTSDYMAPEVVFGGDYTNKCDVFSYAITLVAVFKDGATPYDSPSSQTGSTFHVELRVANDHSFRPEMPAEWIAAETPETRFFSWCVPLIRRCWAHDEAARPTFEEILKIFDEHRPSIEVGQSEEEQKMDDMLPIQSTAAILRRKRDEDDDARMSRSPKGEEEEVIRLKELVSDLRAEISELRKKIGKDEELSDSSSSQTTGEEEWTSEES